ncbi:MAG: hypothetical protein ACRDZV_00270 [Acidimicrobiia bacterium]
MNEPNLLIVHAAGHPVPAVHRAGFSLDHPYVERCWAPILGPSSILLLRRMPDLWKQAPTVAVPLDELARSLGLGAGTGRNSPMWRTLERVVTFRFAAWSGERELDVYTEVPPLSPRHLDRVPESTRTRHEELLGAHLDGLAAATGTAASIDARPARMADRLDRLQAVAPAALAQPGIGR